MEKNSQDEIIRAYALLKSLRKNVDQITKPNIEEIYVNEFHSAIDKLTICGIDVSEFRIPDSKIAPIITNAVWHYGGGHTDGVTYSKEKYVKKTYFLTKIDTVLGYFEIITSEKPKKIGFRTSQD